MQQVYLGRKDTSYVETAVIASTRSSFYNNIFSNNDIDKQIKIWISTTPPWYNAGGGSGQD